jgi:N-sulfoglucosamine sulfohydrolase
MKDEDPIIRYWGAYAVFLVQSKKPPVQETLRKMIEYDELPANRLMAAQALGLCGDAEGAFNGIMKEVTETKRGYVQNGSSSFKRGLGKVKGQGMEYCARQK